MSSVNRAASPFVMRHRKKYALWLIPEGGAYERLCSVIKGLSLRFASPVFQPHVTLLGGLGEPEERLKDLVLQMAQLAMPLEIRLTELQHLDEYYKCLFVRVQETETVTQTHALAKRLFRKRDRHGYIPHVSLLYAELPRSEKEHLVEELGKQWDIRFVVSNVHVYATAGAPDMWYQVCSCPLGEPST